MIQLLKNLFNEILALKERSKVFVLTSKGWKMSRWSKLKAGQIIRLLYPSHYENYCDPRECQLVLKDSFKTNICWCVKCAPIELTDKQMQLWTVTKGNDDG